MIFFMGYLHFFGDLFVQSDSLSPPDRCTTNRIVLNCLYCRIIICIFFKQEHFCDYFSRNFLTTGAVPALVSTLPFQRAGKESPENSFCQIMQYKALVR